MYIFLSQFLLYSVPMRVNKHAFHFCDVEIKAHGLYNYTTGSLLLGHCINTLKQKTPPLSSSF